MDATVQIRNIEWQENEDEEYVKQNMKRNACQ